MANPIFIGTGCDRAFVELTCAMLSSVDDAGDVPEAIVIVADFGLTPTDHARLRLSAGKLGPKMRFVPLTPESPLIPAAPRFHFPFPMIGCLVTPKTIEVPGARMLVLDSDMIINSSLRPLFEIDLQGHPMAAVRDMLVEPELKVRGRELNPNYFNTGLLLIDVDLWNERSIGDKAMIWLADQPSKPEWPDQDALNEVIGSDWLRLDRDWNLAYCGEPRQFTYEEYANAHIVHFSGAKPTEHRSHPAVPLFDRQVERVAEKTDWQRPDRVAVDRVYVSEMYEVLLGREMESPDVASPRLGLAASYVVTGFLVAQEFRDQVMAPLEQGRPLAPERWPGPLSLSRKLWMQDRLAILPETADAIEQATSWREALAALVADDRLMTQAGLEIISAAPLQQPVPVSAPRPRGILGRLRG